LRASDWIAVLGDYGCWAGGLLATASVPWTVSCNPADGATLLPAAPWVSGGSLTASAQARRSRRSTCASAMQRERSYRKLLQSREGGIWCLEWGKAICRVCRNFHTRIGNGENSKNQGYKPFSPGFQVRFVPQRPEISRRFFGIHYVRDGLNNSRCQPCRRSMRRVLRVVSDVLVNQAQVFAYRLRPNNHH
jgi:hypothetical protein